MKRRNGSTFNWATHVLQLGDFLRARILAHMGVLQSLQRQRTSIISELLATFHCETDIYKARSFVSHIKEELVGEHVDGELLVAEGVDAGRAAA